MQTRQVSSPQSAVLRLEISCSGKDSLTTSLSSQHSAFGDTLRTYEESHIPLATITQRSQQLFETLNQANRRGRLSPHLLQSLKDIGQLFRDELLTPKLKERLNASQATFLVVNLDERLVQIPWELLHDGSQFLCQRYAVGRLVQTKQDVHLRHQRHQEIPLQVLILADLDGNLPAARKEGKEIRTFLESLPHDVRVMMRSASVSKEFLRTKIRQYQWIHYAGHADYDEASASKGWRLSNGWFAAADVEKMMGTGTMPALIFANACQSARTQAWSLSLDQQKKAFGLANAFLLSGTRHFLGTSWEIPDEPGRRFALAFYRQLVEGVPIGQAVCHARQQVMADYGEQQLVWASYLLYGDPTHRYAVTAADELDRSSTNPPSYKSHQQMASAETIRTSSKTDKDAEHTSIGRRKTMVAVAMIAGLLGVLVLANTGGLSILKPSNNSPSVAQAAYQSGDYATVLDVCPNPETATSADIHCTLLRASVLLAQGDLQNANRLYQLVSQSDRATAWESSEALMGLGRIESIRGSQRSAIGFYQQAVQAAPQRRAPLLALAMLKEAMGHDREALAHIKSAEQMGPAEDIALAAMRHSLAAKLSLDSDAERLARIDKLIDDLAQSSAMATPAGENPPVDRPLGVWLMALESSGFATQEGAPELFTALMENRLQAQPNLRVVDRHLMAKTLSELKLSAYGQTDPQSRLRLGRLQAAHLLISGRMVFSGPQTQVTLRCVDIETSRLVTTIVSTYEAKQSFHTMADQAVEKLLDKLN